MMFFGLGFLVVGLLIGFIAGHRHASFHSALAENKIAAINLKFNHEKLSPQLREYLKVRIYSNVLVRYPNDPGYLLARDWDFGPVDRQVLGELATYKGLYRAWRWEEALAGK